MHPEQHYEPVVEAFYNESIIHEKIIAALYGLFAGHFREDERFWKMLAGEEEDHAAIIRNGKNCLFRMDLFTPETLRQDLDLLRRINSGIHSTISAYREVMPDRSVAFMRAAMIEESSEKFYFQRIRSAQTDSPALYVVRNIVREEVNHEKRIVERFREVFAKPQASVSAGTTLPAVA
jgi:hypothetical protein